MFYYVYVLESLKDSNFYTGVTNNPRRRFGEHNRGENLSTKSRKSFRLIYYEACLSEKDAKKREEYLKTAWGKRYLKNRLKNYLLNDEKTS